MPPEICWLVWAEGENDKRLTIAVSENENSGRVHRDENMYSISPK